MNIDTLTSIDETNAALLAALERIEKECVCPACQIAARALEEHKARLVELTKDNSMDKNTIPAWAIEAIMELADKRIVTGNGTQAAQTISRHSPDAEALAVALEKMLYMDGSHKHCNDTCHYKQCEKVLLSYRSRFPKE